MGMVTRKEEVAKFDFTVEKDMCELLQLSQQLTNQSHACERRENARINRQLFAQVRGLDSSNEPFDLLAIVENISLNGIFILLAREVETGQNLSILVDCANALPNCSELGLLLAQGTVVRSERQFNSINGLAIQFNTLKFI